MFNSTGRASTLQGDLKLAQADVPSSAFEASGINPAIPAFPAIPVQHLLDQNERLIARIKLCYGADSASFDAEVLSLIRAYAGYVHLLPASPTRGFSDAGGLFRLGLEVGFFALQGTDAHIFCGRSTISERRELEPRWRLATFIAGLCSELHLALGTLKVTDTLGQVWPSCLFSLTDWLQQRQAHHYTVDCLGDALPSRGYGLFALHHVVPQAVLQDLAWGNTVIVPQLFASISGLVLPQSRNVLDELVRRSLALVVDRNLLRHARRSGTASTPQPQRQPQPHQRHPIGLHHQRFVIDAMRHLMAFSANWTPNTDKSRIHWGLDGLYIAWPLAGFDLIKLWEQDKLAGLPKTPGALLNFIADLDLCDTQPGHAQDSEAGTEADTAADTPAGHAGAGVELQVDSVGDDRSSVQKHNAAQLHLIRPPGTKAEFQAIRIKFADLLLSAVEPRPARIDSSLKPPTATVNATPTSAPISPSQGGAPTGLQAGAAGHQPATATSRTGLIPHTPTPRRAWRGMVDTASDSSGTASEVSNNHSLESLHSPAQLTLIPELDAQAATGAPPSATLVHQASAALTLIAPMRLSIAIRTLLNRWLALLSSPAIEPPATACAVRTDGLFIPLQRFEAQGFPAFEAVRGLADLKLLVHSGEEGATPTSHMTIQGSTIQGIVLSATCIQGWPPRRPSPIEAPTGDAMGLDGSRVS